MVKAPMVICVAVALAACFALPAEAQDTQLLLSVNYGSAYRNGHWTPVDVVAMNKGKQAVKGDLVVEIYDASGQVQSPVHRQPVDLPMNSSKRYRFTCRLGNVDRIEVRLYNGRSEVGGSGLRIPLPPIREEDLLALLLDERAEDYAFLSDLYSGDKAPRFFREALGTEDIGALSENPRCYEAFDLIIFGDIDPSRLGEGARDALQQYVIDGGTIVVLTGAHGAAYRGTWLENLAGVAVGETAYAPADAFALAALGADKAQGAAAGESCSFAPLSLLHEGPKRLGAERTLATRTAVGKGAILFLANDHKTRALDACVGYLDLWRSVAARRAGASELNWAQAARFGSGAIPALAGVTLLPRSSVLTYLCAYFLVAIVANWVFWSRKKRQEMAWVCLVFFSFAFTAYAMIYGAAGRAQRSQMFQYDVIQPPSGTGIARVESFTGIISSYSARYSPALPLRNALVADISHEYAGVRDPYAPRPRRESISACNYIYGEPPALDDLNIGASDLRMLRISSDDDLAGGIESTIKQTEHGISGGIRNQTGYKLTSPHVIFNRRWYPLREGAGGELTLGMPSERGGLAENQNYYRFAERNEGKLPKIESTAHSFLQNIVSSEFQGMGMPGALMPGDMGDFPTDDVPLLAAVIDRPVTPAIDAKGAIEFKGGVSLLLAPLAMERSEIAPPADVALPVEAYLQGYQQQFHTGWTGNWRDGGGMDAWLQSAAQINSWEPQNLRIHNATISRLGQPSTLVLHVYEEVNETHELEVRLMGRTNATKAAPLSGEAAEDMSVGDMDIRHRTFQLDSTAVSDLTNKKSFEVHVSFVPKPGANTSDLRRGEAYTRFAVECRAEFDRSVFTNREPIAWQ